jgi:hypothetical protein
VSNRQIFRTRSGYVFAGLVFALCALLTATLWLTEDVQTAVSGSLWAAAFVLAAYLIFIRPKIEIFDEGVIITNPFTSIAIGWHKVIDIDVRYSLTIVTPAKRISSWAAVAPGRYHARTVHSSELKGYKLSNQVQIRPGESPRTSSGEAAQLCRLRFEAFDPETANKMETRVQINALSGTALIVCAIAALVIQNLH